VAAAVAASSLLQLLLLLLLPETVQQLNSTKLHQRVQQPGWQQQAKTSV
jgi:hypothetical protein